MIEWQRRTRGVEYVVIGLRASHVVERWWLASVHVIIIFYDLVSVGRWRLQKERTAGGYGLSHTFSYK